MWLKLFGQVIYSKKVKDTVAEKRMEAQTSLWDAMTGLGEVGIPRLKT